MKSTILPFVAPVKNSQRHYPIHCDTCNMVHAHQIVFKLYDPISGLILYTQVCQGCVTMANISSTSQPEKEILSMDFSRFMYHWECEWYH